MSKPPMEKLEHGLELDSRLSELSRVWTWVEALADEYGFSHETRYAIHLCMEEALANVVMHGYRDEPGHPIAIRASVAGQRLSISIEDEAPHFAPDEAVATAPSNIDLQLLEPGGNGIRLLRRFAASVVYEPLAQGNRLTIGFPIPDHSSKQSG